MKKLILFLCIAFMSCKKNNTTPATGGSMKFNANGKEVIYSGVFNQSNLSGVGLAVYQISATEWAYSISGGMNVNDNLSINFRTIGPLQPGQVNISGYSGIGYEQRDTFYFFGDPAIGTDFSIYVNSYSNKILNGTFNGVLKTINGLTMNITNGQLINVPTTN